MNFFNWLKANTPTTRRNRLIASTIKKQSEYQQEETKNFCYLSNVRIMEKLIRECPEDHLIMVERFFGLGNVSFPTSFCAACLDDLLPRMSPLDDFLVEQNTGRILFNPANCHHSGDYMVQHAFDHKVIGYNNDNKEVPYDIITFWAFVPYPERWQQQ